MFCLIFITDTQRPSVLSFSILYGYFLKSPTKIKQNIIFYSHIWHHHKCFPRYKAHAFYSNSTDLLHCFYGTIPTTLRRSAAMRSTRLPSTARTGCGSEPTVTDFAVITKRTVSFAMKPCLCPVRSFSGSSLKTTDSGSRRTGG